MVHDYFISFHNHGDGYSDVRGITAKSLGVTMNDKLKLKEFDSELSPKDPQNQEAAHDRGLQWDPHKRHYVDSEGSLVRDQFGQPL